MLELVHVGDLLSENFRLFGIVLNLILNLANCVVELAHFFANVALDRSNPIKHAAHFDAIRALGINAGRLDPLGQIGNDDLPQARGPRHVDQSRHQRLSAIDGHFVDLSFGGSRLGGLLRRRLGNLDNLRRRKIGRAGQQSNQ